MNSGVAEYEKPGPERSSLRFGYINPRLDLRVLA